MSAKIRDITTKLSNKKETPTKPTHINYEDEYLTVGDLRAALSFIPEYCTIHLGKTNQIIIPTITEDINIESEQDSRDIVIFDPTAEDEISRIYTIIPTKFAFSSDEE